MPKKPKSIAKLKKELDILFAKYIRQRDSKDGFFTCISCGKYQPVSQMQSGHYYARVFTATRWDERNSNGQDIRCNMFLHGNLLNYRIGMIAKYGQKVVDDLEAIHNKPIKLDRFDLERMIDEYKTKLKCN